MNLVRCILLLACLLMLAGARPAAADPLTPEQKDAVQQLIRDTLANHPEIVIEALKAAQQKSDAEAADNVRRAIVDQRARLVSDPASPVGGNASGDVTIVEFFDYRCPYCKEVEPSLEALLKEDRKLRIVYKEFPILGAASVYAARVALASRGQGKYDAFHRAMMAVKGTIDSEVVRRTAAGVGIDMAKLESAVKAAEIDGIIKGNYALAESLEITGTPAFIIGDTMVPGVADIDTLRKLVAEVRKGG
jgi:protein-disulfide isomerase